MSIEIKKGNIFETSCEYIVCFVNTMGTTEEAGLEKEFMKRFPKTYESFQKKVKTGNFAIGSVIFDENIIENDRKIIFFPYRTHWKLPITEGNFLSSLVVLRYFIARKNIKSVALYKPPENFGSIRWTVVKRLLFDNLKNFKEIKGIDPNFDCRIEIYE